MYKHDQSARMQSTIDWQKLSKEDDERKKRLNELLDSGKVITARDHYHAAMIFQHGGDTIASSMAVKMMRKAIELDSSMNKWLLAAAIDRDLMRRGQPQTYGTQYMKKSMDAKWERYTIDSTKVTDEERKAYGVETLAEQKIKERRMNLTPIYDYYKENNSISEVIKHIRKELKKGDVSEYNVSESGINDFGYQLMAENKNQDALKIFQLNTELFPKGFNTWDSLGECLLKLNRKEEGRKAYAKSLELNPNNMTAKKVLEEK
jgi:tetratricopeptide (TPR) repeat protein